MQGIIKSCLPSKKYGFIKGDDGKDYYFKYDDVINVVSYDEIEDGHKVFFSEKATPKGYQAYNIKQQAITTYKLPTSFMTSQKKTIPDWEVVYLGNWISHGYGKSMDAARDSMISTAKAAGANALVEVQYHRGTDSDGNYQYSVHSYSGRLAMVGKKSEHHKMQKDKLIASMTSAFDEYKKYQKTAHKARITNSIMIAIFVFMLLGLFINPGESSVVLAFLSLIALSFWRGMYFYLIRYKLEPLPRSALAIAENEKDNNPFRYPYFYGGWRGSVEESLEIIPPINPHQDETMNDDCDEEEAARKINFDLWSKS